MVAKKIESKRVGIALRTTEIQYALVSGQSDNLAVHEAGSYPAEDPINAFKQLKKVALTLPCYLAVSHRDVIIKTLRFPSCIKDSELRKLLHLNAEHYFSCSRSSIYYDFEFLSAMRNKVRIIGSKKLSIDYWQQCCRAADLRLKAISVDSLALEQYLNQTKLITKEHVYGVIVCNRGELLQAVVGDGAVLFVKTVDVENFSLSLWNQEIQKFFRLYEASKSFVYPITHVILLVFDNNMLTKMRAWTSTVQLEAIHVEFSVPIGVALAC